MASTFFTTMGLHEVDPDVSATSCCVASDLADYVAKAVRLGQDAHYRAKVANAISLRNYRIFNDAQTSFEWARFLCRAMGVVINNDDLAKEMEYIPEPWQQNEFTAAEFLIHQERWKRAASIESILHRRVVNQL